MTFANGGLARKASRSAGRWHHSASPFTLDTDKGETSRESWTGCIQYALSRVLVGSTKLDASAIEEELKCCRNSSLHGKRLRQKINNNTSPRPCWRNMAVTGGLQLQGKRVGEPAGGGKAAKRRTAAIRTVGRR